jgi:hypothetical protein
MKYWLIQLILAARKNDGENGWVQVLVFVILSVFWALGSIIKAKANKKPAGKEPTPSKPKRKPPELTIDLKMLKQLFGLPEEEEPKSGGEVTKSQTVKPRAAKPQVVKPQVQHPHRKIVRPQPMAAQKPQGAMPQVAMPQVQPKLGKVPGLTGEAEVLAEIPQAKYLSDILSDYEDSEKLRRAILHYEILGKPISLRGPSEHIGL